MFHPQGPTLLELARQALSSTESGYDLLAPKFEYTPYRTPDEIVAAVVEKVGSSPRVLDLCCGTGAGMKALRPHCQEIVGLDISEGMLAIAAAKGSYDALHRAALGTRLPFADGAFAGIVSSGVFTTGHVGAEGLDDLTRICRPGGVIVLTVKTTLWSGGFAAHLADLPVTQVDETAPYVSMPGEAGTVPSLAIVLKRD